MNYGVINEVLSNEDRYTSLSLIKGLPYSQIQHFHLINPHFIKRSFSLFLGPRILSPLPSISHTVVMVPDASKGHTRSP